ncbi:MAG TPA: hypothetical protein PLP27_02250 [Crocinitomicaceae bacterium]|nr:hypothetical protein [Crocinitomicaceae bacterium]
MSAYEQLLNQIDAFIRKYYKNRMIKGVILFATFTLLLFLSVVTLEYFGRFSSMVRLSLLLVFLLGSLGLMTYYVLIPLAKILSFGKRISREQASLIIGNFFPQVSDKLFNTLELGNETDVNHPNFELIRASVSQRSKQLSVFDFPAVIDLKANRKYAKYFAVPLVIFIALLLFKPSFIKEPTQRVISYDKQFEKPRDFNFYLLNNEFIISEGDDYTVDVEVKGRILPENISVNSPLGTYQLQKITKNKFTYTFHKVSKSFRFQLAANNETSEIFNIEVIPNAVMGKFNAKIVYPTYLGKEPKNVENVADLNVPEGSVVEWDVFSKNTKQLRFKFSDTTFTFDKTGFKFKKRFFNSTPLAVLLRNEKSDKSDSLNYFVNVIKDAYPTITVNESTDTISSSIRFFEGKISDDYGLTTLTFHYDITSKDGKVRKKSKTVVKPSGTAFSFNYAYDFRNDTLNPEDRIEYYFIVRDNDGVNGSKSSRSQSFTYKLPSVDELIDKRNESLDNAKKDIQNIQKDVKQFHKSVEELKKDNLNSKNNSWEKLNKIQELQNQQQSLQQQIEQLKDNLNESLDEKNSMMEMTDELKEKYDLLQELLEQVMDKEMMDLLKEMEELLKKNNQNQFNQQFDKFEQKSQDLNKKLDRSIELLKKTQVNELMDDVEKKLDELAKEQDELRSQMEQNKMSKEDALKQQKDIEDKFNQLKEDLDKLNELNDDLKRPYDLEKFNEMKDEISDDLKKASENIQKGKSSKASENQKSASDKMKEMSSGMDAMQADANAKQDEEDMQLIRVILKNLIASSVEQELLMNDVSKVNFNDPYFNMLARNQRKLIDKSRPIIDSLIELAKRQPQIASFIDKEIASLSNAQKQALKAFGDRNKNQLNVHTQFAMTSYNNLALMLNESLQQMQQQMQQSGKSGSCENPGDGEKGKKGQSGQGESGEGGDFKQQLKDQLEKMKQGMQPGGRNPGNTPGNDGQPGENGLPSSELVKIISQQRMLRQQLEQMRQEMNKDGKGTGNMLNPLIDELNKQEKDLLNKKVGREQLQRQQDILTRLLESEKALRERGFDDKRESKSAKNYNLSNQNRIDEYNKQKLHQLELFRTIDPEYSKYYMDKASEYFNRQL